MKNVLAVFMLCIGAFWLAGCGGEHHKNPAVDLSIVTGYWKARHIFEDASQSHVRAEAIWEERNAFLLAHSGEPTTWSVQEKETYKEIENRFVASVEAYNDHVAEYDYAIMDLPRNKLCRPGDESVLPGNIPNPIPVGLRLYDHGDQEWTQYISESDSDPLYYHSRWD